MRQANVIGARTLTHNVRELTIDPGPGFAFDPGQWVSVRIPADQGEDLARSYSIASAPREAGTFDLAVTLVEDGPGSGFLHRVPVGTPLTISRAQGFFTMEAYDRPVIMVATGTGLSPFRSMLQALTARHDRLPYPVTVLLGVRSEQDLLYADELATWQRTIAGFRFVPTLSRPGDGWTGPRGYVQTHLPDLVRGHDRDCDVYVCGLSRMVREVRTILKGDLGLPKDRIHTERYD